VASRSIGPHELSAKRLHFTTASAHTSVRLSKVAVLRFQKVSPSCSLKNTHLLHDFKVAEVLVSWFAGLILGFEQEVPAARPRYFGHQDLLLGHGAKYLFVRTQ